MSQDASPATAFAGLAMVLGVLALAAGDGRGVLLMLAGAVFGAFSS